MSGGLKVDTGHCHLLCKRVDIYNLDGKLQAPVALLSLEVQGLVHDNANPLPPSALCWALVRCVDPGSLVINPFCVVLELVSIVVIVWAWSGRQLSPSMLCQSVSISTLCGSRLAGRCPLLCRVRYLCVVWAPDDQQLSSSAF